MADACPTESGIDRRCRGCDSDGDGYSNPDGLWGVNNGADAFINDATQWSDFDGDGFGNSGAIVLGMTDPLIGSQISGLCSENQDACPLQFGDSRKWG